MWRSGATTRPRHHSGPVRGVVPGAMHVRETTALGGAEPIAGKEPNLRRPGRPGSQANGDTKRALTPNPWDGPPWTAGRERGHGGSEADKRQKSMKNKDGSAF